VAAKNKINFYLFTFLQVADVMIFIISWYVLMGI